MLKTSFQMLLFLLGGSLFGIATSNAQETASPSEGAAIAAQISPVITATQPEKVRELYLVGMAVNTVSSQPLCFSGGFALVPYTVVKEVRPNSLPTICLRSQAMGPCTTPTFRFYENPGESPRGL